MTDTLHSIISETLKTRWPAPWFGGDKQHQQISDLADAIIDQLLDLAGHGKLIAAINTIATPKSYCIRCGIPHTEKCLRP